MSSHRTTLPRTALTALAVGSLSFSLVACGGSDDESEPAATTTVTVTPTPTEDADDTTGSATPSTGTSTGDDALLAAAGTALGAVDGTVFSIDRDSRGWEVHVVSSGGTESELLVSADGGTVEGDPVVDPDDADDADDLAERQQLLADAELDVEAAVAAARTSVPDGTVTGVDLDTDRGAATWDVQLDEDTATGQTVTVDAVTGDVLRTERDD